MPKRRADRRKYANRKPRPAVDRGPSYDPDLPVAGCYLVRLRQNGPPCALRIWFGPPLDPETLDEMDRSPRWQAIINRTQLVDVFSQWPACARRPIDLAEHDRIAILSLTLDPNSPFYDPLKQIDPLTAPPPF